MQAAVLDAVGERFRVVEVELHDPGPGEVEVKVAATGICRSDLHVRTGATAHPVPVIAGHEGSGVVSAVGPGVTTIDVGDHVALSWVASCGTCFFCSGGLPAQCETTMAAKWAGTLPSGRTPVRVEGDPVFQFCSLGTFAERTVVSELSCVRVRNDLPLDSVALVGCAVATGVGAVLRTAEVEAGSSVVVLGCGGIGLNMVQGARLAGAAVVVAVDRAAAKLEFAGRFGATDGVLAEPRTDLGERVRELTSGRGADYVFDSTGHPPTMSVAYDLARRGGTIVYVGIGPPGVSVSFAADRLARDDKTVLGSYYGRVNPRVDIPMLLDRYAAGELMIDELITRRFPLGAIEEAFAGLEDGSVARSIIEFDLSTSHVPGEQTGVSA
jgi:S-(hydroxymethyl)glutathione dehydrogenase/alcohol dehydrogenase